MGLGTGWVQALGMPLLSKLRYNTQLQLPVWETKRVAGAMEDDINALYSLTKFPAIL